MLYRLKTCTFIAHIPIAYTASFIRNLHSNSPTTQSDTQKTRAIAISFEEKWKTLGLKKKKETTFTAQDGVLTLDSKKAVAFYYCLHPKLSQISHCNGQLNLDWRARHSCPLRKQKLCEGNWHPSPIHIWSINPSKFHFFKDSFKDSFKDTLARLFSAFTPDCMLPLSWVQAAKWPQLFTKKLYRVISASSEGSDGHITTNTANIMLAPRRL